MKEKRRYPFKVFLAFTICADLMAFLVLYCIVDFGLGAGSEETLIGLLLGFILTTPFLALGIHLAYLKHYSTSDAQSVTTYVRQGSILKDANITIVLVVLACITSAYGLIYIIRGLDEKVGVLLLAIGILASISHLPFTKRALIRVLKIGKGI